MAGFIIGGILGLIVGYHAGIIHGLRRLGNAERKARQRNIGFPWRKE